VGTPARYQHRLPRLHNLQRHRLTIRQSSLFPTACQQSSRLPRKQNAASSRYFSVTW